MNNGMHHAHIRKRIYKKLEKYPHPNILIRGLDYLVFVVALVTPAVFLPQVVQLYTVKSAAGFSAPTWFLFGTFAVIWMTYGIIHREWPIIISNVLMACLYFVFVAGIFMYQ